MVQGSWFKVYYGFGASGFVASGVWGLSCQKDLCSSGYGLGDSLDWGIP